MEDELLTLQNNQVTVKSKITELQRVLKNNEAIITKLGDQLSKFSNSSINCKISQGSLQISTCSMATDKALELVNRSVTSGLLHKLSGDNRPNERNSKSIDESLQEDNIVIIFEKMMIKKDKRE